MFKKNNPLSIFGILFAVAISALDFTFGGTFDCLKTIDIIKLIILGALGGITIFFLAKSLLDGSYGE
jgi:asparagine N-glycosylation enzyme membrane subunit Stt3